MAEAMTQLNYLRMTPRKVRAVASLIQGLSVNEAEAQLLMQRRRAAQPLLKLLRSAVANVKNSKRLDPAKLYVSRIRVDQGPMLKRFLPRARGAASPIEKKMSHVTLMLRERSIAAPSRFVIAVPEKPKLPPGERGRGKKPTTPKEEKEVSKEPKRPGFFKRMFSRKAGFAK